MIQRNRGIVSGRDSGHETEEEKDAHGYPTEPAAPLKQPEMYGVVAVT